VEFETKGLDDITKKIASKLKYMMNDLGEVMINLQNLEDARKEREEKREIVEKPK